MDEQRPRLVAGVGPHPPPVLEHRAGVRTVVVAPVCKLELLDDPLLSAAILRGREADGGLLEQVTGSHRDQAE